MHPTASPGQLVVGTSKLNKKAGSPATKGIPATTQADYRGNFGLAGPAPDHSPQGRS